MFDSQFIRRPLWMPKKGSEIPYILLILIMIPVTYWFEMWVVLPSLFSPSSGLYWFIFGLGHFVMHNVVGNYLGIIMCDTSIRGRKMPTETAPGVQLCSVCETLTPPRAYHCPTCDICILKRDHHCMFAGTCIGHYNHRFFILFIFYMFFATFASLPFNVYFLWDLLTFTEVSFLMTLAFPLIMFIIDMGPDNIDVNTVYITIFTLNIAGLVFCATWFYFHYKLIIGGKVVHEMRKCINSYDLGLKKNVAMVLGDKWHLAWISPFIYSQLPSDGLTFPLGEDQTNKEE